MFTGLIEEMGKITNISRKGSGMEISVKADKVMQNVKIGDSIAVKWGMSDSYKFQ